MIHAVESDVAARTYGSQRRHRMCVCHSPCPEKWSPPEPTIMGYLAENMVLRQLSTWPEKIEITYYREKKEVDFVLTHVGNKHLPLEVKFREQVAQQDALRGFLKKFGGKLGVTITRQKESRYEGELLDLPLRYFLLGCGRT